MTDRRFPRETLLSVGLAIALAGIAALIATLVGDPRGATKPMLIGLGAALIVIGGVVALIAFGL